MKIHQITVLPDTPKELEKLVELAYNMYFSWDDEVVDLYKEMDSDLWEECEHNPARFLTEVSDEKFSDFSKDKDFIKKLESVYSKFTDYMNASTWYESTYGTAKKINKAYFSCEYGIHDAMPIFSGGLGVLSGDHIKTASDLGLPLVGVGLLYKSGYFRQRINQEGTQTEEYKQRSFYNLSLKPVLDKNGEIKVFSIKLAEELVYYYVWEMKVGRVKVLLLDTFVPLNSVSNQYITNRLYDENRETRIRQEILLGVGGFQALKELGYEIDMYHINEGHSAFLLLEHLRFLMCTHNFSFEDAKNFVTESTIFTTHTPVPAGNERFSIDLIMKYFKQYTTDFGISWDYFLSLGREFPNNSHEEFCLTVLALKLSSTANGVAKLHGEVSRKMWQNLYHNVPEEEVPITSITNGVHGQTWLDRNLKTLIHDKRRDKKPHNVLYDKDFFNTVKDIKDEELWEWKKSCKLRLVEYCRNHLEKQYIYANAGNNLVERARTVLDPDCLTIGFARRFATYKRGSLFLRDPQRLYKIISKINKPVQFIIAGKSHPADQHGKDIIQSIHSVARELGISNRIVFLENYNIDMARHIVSGVDVWLNNPIKPLEASGTSGMKAGMNACPNLSITDGWWAEAYNSNIGWDLSSLASPEDINVLNDIESAILYHHLENEITDAFYDRDKDGLPRKWLSMMKQSIIDVGGQFNFVRTLQEYVSYYHKMIEVTKNMRRDNFAGLHEFSQWKKQILKNWPLVRIHDVTEQNVEKINRGKSLSVRAKLTLGELSHEDVLVQCYFGTISSEDEKISDGHAIDMKEVRSTEDMHEYECEFKTHKGGRFGYTVRVFPRHSLLTNPFILGLLIWYEGK